VTRPEFAPWPTVELTLAIRIRAEPAAAAELTTRLVESVEDALGVTLTARPAASVDAITVQPAVRIEPAARRVLVRGTALPLTRLEFELLLFLCLNPDVVFDRRTLLAKVWGYPRGGERTVDVHVRKLRGKFEPEQAPITTVRGVGYRFDPSADVIVA
jgi:two-component system phosphate regulon response regulator PhoB